MNEQTLKKALRQVRSNKGSAGVDGMTVDQLGDYLKQHWPVIREQLLNGTYEPKPVRRVEIPKPDGGGVRKAWHWPTVLESLHPASGDAGSAEAVECDASPFTAMGFDRVGRHIKPWRKRSSTSRKVTDG